MKKVNNDRYDIKRGKCGSCAIYSIEYKCSNDEINVTTIHMIRVKLSNIKPQLTSKASDFTHDPNSINTSLPFIPTSKKPIKERKKEKIKQDVVKKADPLGPMCLPNKLADKKPSNEEKIINKYIYKLICN